MILHRAASAVMLSRPGAALVFLVLYDPHLPRFDQRLPQPIRHLVFRAVYGVVIQPSPQDTPRLPEIRNIQRPHRAPEQHDAHAETVHGREVEGLQRVGHGAEELVRVGVCGVEGRFGAELAPPDGSAREGCGREEAGGAEEEEGELAQRARGGDGRAFGGGDGGGSGGLQWCGVGWWWWWAVLGRRVVGGWGGRACHHADDGEFL